MKGTDGRIKERGRAAREQTNTRYASGTRR